MSKLIGEGKDEALVAGKVPEEMSASTLRFYVDVDVSKYGGVDGVKKALESVYGVVTVRTEEDVERSKATEDYISTL